MSGSGPHRIFYKGDEADFVIFIEDTDLVEKYKKGDTTIPLIDIVGIYKVFINRQGGNEGVLDEASKQELNLQFGKSDVDEVIKIILKDGSDKSGTHLGRGGASKNDSIGNTFVNHNLT